jgi:hypothetical protein
MATECGKPVESAGRRTMSRFLLEKTGYTRRQIKYPGFGDVGLPILQPFSWHHT